jgi:predicted ATPase
MPPLGTRRRLTLDAADAVVVDSGIAVHEVVEGLANLVAKSLLSADLSSAVADSRLLDMTHDPYLRTHALKKLTETGKLEPIARCHTKYQCEGRRLARRSSQPPGRKRLRRFKPEVPDGRQMLPRSGNSRRNAKRTRMRGVFENRFPLGASTPLPNLRPRGVL